MKTERDRHGSTVKGETQGNIREFSVEITILVPHSYSLITQNHISLSIHLCVLSRPLSHLKIMARYFSEALNAQGRMLLNTFLHLTPSRCHPLDLL